MSNSAKRSSWFRAHASAVFIGSLLSVSLFLLFSGQYLQGQTSDLAKIGGSILVQLSGAALAACVATAFLGFSDVRTQLAEVLGRLFFDGKIVGLLASETQETIRKEILASRSDGKVLLLEPSLLRHLTELTDLCLSAVHVQNYNIRDRILDHPNANPSLYMKESSLSLRIGAHHLSQIKTVLSYPLIYEVALTPGLELADEDFLLGFEARLGEEIIGADSDCIKIIRTRRAGLDTIRLDFEKELAIDGEMDIVVNYKVALLRDDNMQIYLARFPTRGFNVDLTFRDDHTYSGAWVKSRDPLQRDLPGRGEVREATNGLSAITNDWVLPGEGVCVMWIRNPETDIPGPESAVKAEQ